MSQVIDQTSHSVVNTQTMPVLSTASLAGYLDSIQAVPVLSREQEIELFVAYQQNNDLAAVRTIVLSHLRYVAYVARSYAGYGLPLEDIIQQGNLGLMKSVKKFNLQHEVRLVTFAVHWIKAEIHEFILKNWKIVKVATTKAQRKLFFNLRKAKARLGWFNQDEIDAVSKDLKVKPEEVLEMESRLANFDESFDLPAGADEETIKAPVNYLTLGATDDPAIVAADQEIVAQQNSGLATALQALDDRARHIVESRWLGSEKLALKDLSLVYGVSIERIRQIEKKAFEKMQPYLQELKNVSQPGWVA